MEYDTVQDAVAGRAGREYLRVIYEIQESCGKARTSAVAALVGVSEPSATRMIKRLAGLGLLDHAPYHGATLTPAGVLLAHRLIHRRNLIEQYLIRFLDYPAGEADTEVDRLECAVSEEFERRIWLLLRGPGSEPDGDGIYAASGQGAGDRPLTSKTGDPIVRPHQHQGRGGGRWLCDGPGVACRYRI